MFADHFIFEKRTARKRQFFMFQDYCSANFLILLMSTKKAINDIPAMMLYNKT